MVFAYPKEGGAMGEVQEILQLEQQRQQALMNENQSVIERLFAEDLFTCSPLD